MYPSSPLPPLSKASSEPPPTMLGDSPFGTPNNAPIPSPFDESPKPSFETPLSPPLPSYKEPELPPFSNQNNPFNQPSFNQGENVNQNMQQQDWNPPPAPDSNWQNQNIGQNTPFQPPVAGGGQNQILAIISLVLGIIGIITIIPSLLFIFCGIVPFLFGIGALITGFLARSRAQNDPNKFGGSGLAIGGMISGAISVLVPIALVVITLLWVGIALS